MGGPCRFYGPTRAAYLLSASVFGEPSVSQSRQQLKRVAPRRPVSSGEHSRAAKTASVCVSARGASARQAARGPRTVPGRRWLACAAARMTNGDSLWGQQEPLAGRFIKLCLSERLFVPLSCFTICSSLQLGRPSVFCASPLLLFCFSSPPLGPLLAAKTTTTQLKQLHGSPFGRATKRLAVRTDLCASRVKNTVTFLASVAQKFVILLSAASKQSCAHARQNSPAQLSCSPAA